MGTECVMVYIGLGSNLGDRQGLLDQAVQLVSQIQDTKVCQVSAYKSTLPLAQADQPEYLNGVARVQTTLSAQALFAYLRRIEDCLGRERSTQWAPRTIDLDLLLYGEAKINAYQEADIYVLPTHSENFGMTVAESLAAGTPVITTNGAPWSGLEAPLCAPASDQA
jgi:2-amino-4-hydroxy-6-hydroxymethyldihydropteridine diphosphokinase